MSTRRTSIVVLTFRVLRRMVLESLASTLNGHLETKCVYALI